MPKPHFNKGNKHAAKAEPRNSRLPQVRVTEKERADIEAKASAESKSVSDYMRSKLVEAE